MNNREVYMDKGDLEERVERYFEMGGGDAGVLSDLVYTPAGLYLSLACFLSRSRARSLSLARSLARSLSLCNIYVRV